MAPGFWSELEHGSFDLATLGADVLDGLPMVFPHFQPFADHHSGQDAQIVADQNIQHDIVPPALVKVGQQVSEKDLGQFPHDGNAPANAIMSNDQGLHAPSPIVAKGKPIHVTP